jgi:hypothetical protein
VVNRPISRFRRFAARGVQLPWAGLDIAAVSGAAERDRGYDLTHFGQGGAAGIATPELPVLIDMPGSMRSCAGPGR